MTHDQITLAADMWKTMNCREIAPHFGVTPECLRQNFHRCGIKDPKDRRDKDRRLAEKYWFTFGWSRAEIADQLNRSARFVANALRDMARRLQLCLWPPTEYRVERRRMRIVHRAPERVVEIKQLDLFAQAA